MGVEQWTDQRGRRWRRIPVEPREKFIVGVDLGQSSDPTAVCVLHWSRTPTDKWDIKEGHQSTAKEKAAELFAVRHLERLPLGLSYPAIVEHVAMLLQRPPLNDGCELVIDATGVGRAVADLFDDCGMRPLKVTITAGGEQTNQGNRSWHVAKSILVSQLDARLNTGELRFASELSEAPAMGSELKDFRRRVSAAGRYTYEARVGRHDDLVLATAIAVWWAVHAEKNRCGITRGFDLVGYY